MLRRQRAVQGHLLRCHPGFDVGRGNGHAVPGECVFDSGEAVGLPRRPARSLLQSGMHAALAVAAPILGVR